jgi:hypothetical protein
VIFGVQPSKIGLRILHDIVYKLAVKTWMTCGILRLCTRICRMQNLYLSNGSFTKVKLNSSDNANIFAGLEIYSVGK